MNLQDKLDNLKNQREVLKEQFIKVIGAIELLETLIKEEKDATKEKPKK